MLVPVLLLFVFGVMDFCRLCWMQATLQQGADQTVRSAAATVYSANVAATLQSACNARIQSLGLAHYSACVVSVNVGNTAVTVTANDPFSFAFGNLPQLPITLSGTMSGPLAL